jgi:hypothetical protein
MLLEAVNQPRDSWNSLGSLCYGIMHYAPSESTFSRKHENEHLSPYTSKNDLQLPRLQQFSCFHTHRPTNATSHTDYRQCCRENMYTFTKMALFLKKSMRAGNLTDRRQPCDRSPDSQKSVFNDHTAEVTVKLPIFCMCFIAKL